MNMFGEKIMGNNNKGARLGLVGAVIAAIGASICCAGPLVLLGLGVSGAWIANLSAMEPYSPIFLALTVGFLGMAFYKTYTKPKAEECAPGSYCANPKSDRINKVALWAVTLIAVTMIASPYAIPYVFASDTTAGEAPTEQVTLNIKGMTCNSCPVTVKKSLKKLEGVKETIVTLNPPRAIVVYDPKKVTPEEMTVATKNAGFPSTVKNN